MHGIVETRYSQTERALTKLVSIILPLSSREQETTCGECFRGTTCYTAYSYIYN